MRNNKILDNIIIGIVLVFLFLPIFVLILFSFLMDMIQIHLSQNINLIRIVI